ncbi:MAG: ABC transporter ATP-binding protein [Planctomycetota bacterium]|nr:ABC transporter ATP-binding protein [Planctomycetota bacterium]MCX8039388.1 ABC transporter ATP-binding protein [Planctomycetota bacterium]MDW8372127.1 ABC transporter ATP-binding protein [Planctomycetota bacterium]
MADSVVRTEGLTKVYTDFWGRPRVPALQGLSISVARGEVFGLLGPNGSGKTTTIKLLLGLIRPTAGDAFVLGRDPGDAAARARVGYLPEESYLWRFLTADETLAFIGRLFGLSAATIRERSDRLLAQVGLEQARGRKVGEYSKGMARRLGLAQALINEPELVILDEPTSGLDPIGSAEVKDLILALKRAGTTVLLSSHLLADVEDVCDRIAILHRGRLVELGRVQELLADDRRLCIELAAPSPDTVAAIKAAAGPSLLGMAPPRERLEQHFRRIVAREEAVR